jgi:oxygen-independent coproporphyrinogen-3 oxidase
MGYTARHVSPLLGLGVSAISDSWGAFAQNEKVLEKYQERVGKGEIPIFRGHVLDGEDLVIRRHVLNLMTKLETSWRRAEEWTPALEGIEGRLSECAADGLLELGDKSVHVTETGRSVLRNICMAFDARLARKAPQTQLFSKTI